MEAEFINTQKLPDEMNLQALAICEKNVQGFAGLSAGAKTDIHRAVAEALSGVHHSDKVEAEPHRVCQNYAQMRNQELAGRVIGIVNPHWRGSVKSAAQIQVQQFLDRELTRMWNDIESFHTKFGLSYGGAPRPLPYDLAQFRIKFLQEELDEYAAAYEADDSLEAREDMLDALVDLVYVALGTAYLHGFNFAEAWRRVQVANMSKVRVERIEDSKRGSAFDVVKPEGWKPPRHLDLVGVLGAQDGLANAQGLRTEEVDTHGDGPRQPADDGAGWQVHLDRSDNGLEDGGGYESPGQQAPDHDLF